MHPVPKHRRPTLAALALATLTSLTALPASAQMFKDSALDALFSSQRLDELDRAAQRRLAAQADDPQGVLALALGVMRATGDEPLRKRALAAAEACVKRQPQAAPCQYSLGVVLGLQAASEGMLKMASSIGRVRDALQAALQADPDWFPARSGVVDFFLLAPGFVGGSTAKALETARAAPKPEQARALQARVALQSKQYDEVLQALAGLPAAGDSALADSVHNWTTAAAFGLISSGQPGRAQPVLERLSRERPADARPVFGLARVQAETGAHEAALKLLAQAGRMPGSAELPLDYRAGIAHQALGQTDAARSALQRFVSAGKGNKGNLEDARKRLEQLGA